MVDAFNFEQIAENAHKDVVEIRSAWETFVPEHSSRLDALLAIAFPADLKPFAAIVRTAIERAARAQTPTISLYRDGSYIVGGGAKEGMVAQTHLEHSSPAELAAALRGSFEKYSLASISGPTISI